MEFHWWSDLFMCNTFHIRRCSLFFKRSARWFHPVFLVTPGHWLWPRVIKFAILHLNRDWNHWFVINSLPIEHYRSCTVFKATNPGSQWHYKHQLDPFWLSGESHSGELIDKKTAFHDCRESSYFLLESSWTQGVPHAKIGLTSAIVQQSSLNIRGGPKFCMGFSILSVKGILRPHPPIPKSFFEIQQSFLTGFYNPPTHLNPFAERIEKPIRKLDHP